MEARGLAAGHGDYEMANPTDTHIEPVNNEPPTQGVFMGYLALGLAIFAIIVAGIAFYAGTFPAA